MREAFDLNDALVVRMLVSAAPPRWVAVGVPAGEGSL
jgi:hypothetical protein